MRKLPQLGVLRNAAVQVTLASLAFACLLQTLPRLFPGFTLFDRLENISYDWRVRRAHDAQPVVGHDLGAVFIDDETLANINRNFGFTWPWPRQLYGRLVSELTAQGAKAIGFDIMFIERQEYASTNTDVLIGDRLVRSDDYFAGELARAGNVVLAAGSWVEQQRWQALPPAPLFRTNAWRIGHIAIDKDADGVLRRARAYYDDPVEGRFWHLAVLLAARYLELDVDRAEVRADRIVLRGDHGQERTIPTDREGFFYIDWSLKWNDPALKREDFTTLMMEEIARSNGRTRMPRAWRNRLVVVGSLGSGNNISDLGATPLSQETFLMSQHWNVANSILLNRFIHRSTFGTEMLLVLFVGAVSGILTWRLRVLWASFCLMLVLVAYVVLGLLLFVQARYWLPLVLPGGAALVTHLSLVTFRLLREQRERHRVRSVFSKVVSPIVVNELLKDEAASLRGARRPVSVYFADIRGFTTVTDESHERAEDHVRRHHLPPAEAEKYLEAQAREILDTVNQYLSLVADTIKLHNGTFDKYIGDCVMAFWGAPIPNEQHAVDCVRAAIDAQRSIYDLNLERARENQRREQENAARAASGLPPLPLLTLLALGSGINTGVVTVGLMGSDQHVLNYTVFGREVNLASRLEGISGRGRILISATTFRELERLDPGLAGICLPLDPVSVKGFREKLLVYEVDWRKLDASVRDYDTGILTGRGSSPPTDFHGPATGE